MKKKACKSCKYIYTGEECPICKSVQSTNVWKGRLAILDSGCSAIAKKVGVQKNGEYAIKVR